jgi:two-component system LytT family response regulator
MRFKSVLVDDEPLALGRLERLLEAHGDTIEVVGRADSGAAAVEIINRLRPDLLFLDIQMPELNGFDVLGRLEYTPLVIFSTAYDQYALKAFEVHSIDYLLKPVDPRRLKAAVDKLVRLSDTGIADLQERIEKALETVARGPTSRIQVRSGDRIRLVPTSKVVFFRASDKYVEMHAVDGVHLITKSLTQLESELHATDFVRVHRSIIVNVNFIDEIVREGADAYYVRMQDSKKSTLPLSRRYRSRLDLGS